MSAPLRTRWAALCARIDALSLRERAMVLAAALVVIGFGGETLLLGPQRTKLTAVERQAARERTELATLDTQAAELRRQLAADPDEVPRLRPQQVDAELATLSARLRELERSLVPPAQMAPLLEQVLRRSPGVSVVQLQTLAPQALPEQPVQPQGAAAPTAPAAAAAQTVPATSGAQRAAAAGAATAASQPPLYRHGVELTVRGSYADLMRYLSEVERLPVRLHFGRAQLDATRYPAVDLRLTVFTLGLDKAWLAL